MSKHTPGPWVYKAGKEMIFGDGEVVVYETNANEHDCSLIAAAPDLLEALEALVKSNEDHNARVSLIVGRPTGWHDGYLDKARAAIAKARGES